MIVRFDNAPGSGGSKGRRTVEQDGDPAGGTSRLADARANRACVHFFGF